MTDLTVRLASALSNRYRLEHELGQGGMATVYLAHDLRHDRKVAIKLLRPELAAVIGAARFLAEIKTTANLQHPHILPLHDSGEVDGTVFYVMPFVDGESLRDRLTREKQLPVDEAIRITRDVASALDHAHHHRVIHRDIKPENILLQGDHALVADFGIALAAARTEGGSRITETGMSLGTPHYMSPEQAMGEREITAKSDVYALGCVLYEMLVGEPPFTGPTAQAIVARVMTEEPRPLTAQRRTVPRHVAAAVNRALAKLPADRFPSAAAFAEALVNPAVMALAEPAESSASHPMRRGARVAVGAAAVVTIAAAYLAGRTRSDPAGPLVSFTVEMPDTGVTPNRCCGPAQAISPDGKTLVFVGARGSRGPLYRRTLGRVGAEPIPGTEGASVPFFSPDGGWLGFALEGRVRKVPLAGGPALPIVAAENFSGASWRADDLIVYSSRGRLFSVPAGGGDPTPLTTPEAGTAHYQPSLLPDGTAVLFNIARFGDPFENTRIGLLDLKSGRLDTLVRATKAVYSSGHLLYAGADNTLLAQPFDLKRKRLTGQATAILDSLLVRLPAGFHEFVATPAGGLVYQHSAVAGEGHVLWLAGPRGRSPLEVPSQPAGGTTLDDPVVSPDGRRIALRLRTGVYLGDIWILDRQQGTFERLTVGGGRHPSWSPDGRRIVFNRDDGLYVTSADGTGEARRVLGGSGLSPGSWLPDGSGVTFQASVRAGRSDIGMVALTDSVPRWILTNDFRERHPQVSSDGRWLAYSADRSDRFEVYVQPLNAAGPRVQVSTSGGSSPRWSPDGRTLYYVVESSIVAALRAPGDDFQVERRTTVVEGGVTDVHPQNVNWDIHPNGREFLFVDSQSAREERLVWVLNWTAMLQETRAER